MQRRTIVDRKTRRAIKKAKQASAGFAQEVFELKIRAQIAERDLEQSKEAVSQLEARTEVLEKSPLPLPTPEPKNPPVTL